MGSNVTLDGLVVGVYRTKKRLSMRALADRAGISSKTVQNIEHGRHRTHYATAVAIAKALEVPVDHLLVPDRTECGTVAGYERHLGDSVTPCAKCVAAWHTAWQEARK